MAYKTPEWHPAFEEYCEAIFELREDEVDVIQARIADRLSVSRPAVSEMIRRMEKADLVTVENNAIRLTKEGADVARRVTELTEDLAKLIESVPDLDRRTPAVPTEKDLAG